MNSGRGPPTIRIQGQPCHRIGSMLPLPGQFPKFAQLYIYDTEHEIQNRMEGIRNNKVDPEVVVQLSKMLDENNMGIDHDVVHRVRVDSHNRKRNRVTICTQLNSKREVCHMHTCLYFCIRLNKYPTPDDIDRIICAEIPNQSGPS
ncbi:hypothetical protein Lal_00038275 [Lupinus albus]|nr:hypothetical protein Lal_00038275 [Lupinus albus]